MTQIALRGGAYAALGVVALPGKAGSAPAAFARNPLMASVRQIGFEVVQSIRQQRDIIDAA